MSRLLHVWAMEWLANVAHSLSDRYVRAGMGAVACVRDLGHAPCEAAGDSEPVPEEQDCCMRGVHRVLRLRASFWSATCIRGIDSSCIALVLLDLHIPVVLRASDEVVV